MIVAIAATALIAGGCGSSGSSSSHAALSPGAVVKQYLLALRAKDGKKACGLVNTRYKQTNLRGNCEATVNGGGLAIDLEPEPFRVDIGRVRIAGGQATVAAAFGSTTRSPAGSARAHLNYTLVRSGGAWLIDHDSAAVH